MPTPQHTTPTPSGSDLPALSVRQETILSLIVREYIHDPQPVASKALVDEFDLGVSSATVRNEMAALEQLGLIYAPHTSAGRVPTQRGYRYFVHYLLTESNLPPREKRHIAQRFQQAPLDLEAWMRIAAVVLSRTAQSAALVTPPRATDSAFKHLELISTQGRLVLLVLVLQGGSVHQQRLTLAAPVPQDGLSHTAGIINRTCAGLTAGQVRHKMRGQSDPLAQEVGELVADAMQQADHQQAHDVYRYGLSDSLDRFSDDEAQQAIRVLEESSLLDGVLNETLADDVQEVRVVVAGEDRWENLSHLSMVLGRYGTPQARGALGVLGPTRMRYSRAISAVRYVAHLMSGLLVDVYHGGEDD